VKNLAHTHKTRDIHQMKRKLHGFSLIETSLAIASIGMLYIYFDPVSKQINELAENAQRGRITTELEIAKNKFDNEANPKDKDSFNNGNNKERFAKLTPYLKTSNEETYFSGAPVNNCEINPIGVDVQIE